MLTCNNNSGYYVLIERILKKAESDYDDAAEDLSDPENVAMVSEIHKFFLGPGFARYEAIVPEIWPFRRKMEKKFNKAKGKLRRILLDDVIPRIPKELRNDEPKLKRYFNKTM